MQHYKSLIIGGGMTADAAVRGIREVDPIGSIGLISAEPDPPYIRPPLSKGLWQDSSLDQIWRDTEELDVDLHPERVARSLDAEQKRVWMQSPGQRTDEAGTILTYDKLLLATGGTPRRLPFGEEQIIYYRTLQDYQRLKSLTAEKQRFAVVGGGFIGAEIAAALAINDKEVVIIFPEQGIGGLTFPPDLALFLNDYYRDHGVEVLAGETVSGLREKENGQLILHTESGQTVDVESVVAGIGIEPNVTLARLAGLEVDNGILVDEFLRTGDPAIYAAGDVANFYNPILDKRIRVEHEDNANTMGNMAGRSMAGQSEPYNYLPFFYSDLFDLGYEAIGELNPELDTVANWKEPFREGIIYYLQHGRVKGVILWNVWGMIEAARELLAEPKLVKPEELEERMSAAA
jgi:NADPH-dependent 2,4-dienoyl-CoA reductase/sulfur reductase-like enzyme